MCLIGVAWACRVVSWLYFAALRTAVLSRCRAFRAVIPRHCCDITLPLRHRSRRVRTAAMLPHHRHSVTQLLSSRCRRAIALPLYRAAAAPSRHCCALAPLSYRTTVISPWRRVVSFPCAIPCRAPEPPPAKHGRMPERRVVKPSHHPAYGCCVMRRAYSPIAGWLRNYPRALRCVRLAPRLLYAVSVLRRVRSTPRPPCATAALLHVRHRPRSTGRGCLTSESCRRVAATISLAFGG